MGELSIGEKNRVSHRGKALRKLKEVLERYVGA
jgi:inosine/xanthosine triphosphate pyrophosphatase family protein